MSSGDRDSRAAYPTDEIGWPDVTYIDHWERRTVIDVPLPPTGWRAWRYRHYHQQGART